MIAVFEYLPEIIILIFVVVVIVLFYLWYFEDLIIIWTVAIACMVSYVNLGIICKMMYFRVKQNYKHSGKFLFLRHLYVATDPEIIKSILQRRFEHFTHRLFITYESDDPFMANLGFAGGERWKHLRTEITPAFTPGKIKTMLDIMLKGAKQMQKVLNSDCEHHRATDVGVLSSCYTVNIIGECAYNLKCNCFENPDSEFIKHASKFTDVSLPFQTAKISIKALFPKIARWLRITLSDQKTAEFFVQLAEEIIKFRKIHKTGQKDLFKLLLALESKLNVEEAREKVIIEMAAEVFLFFAAGFETSATSLTYSLYELAANPEIQDKLREEIDRVLVKHGGEITYDAIADMQYMSQVLNETLRKYPPLPFITRRCVKDCEIPEYNGLIKEGTIMLISILGLHHDPDFYAEPEKFDPERFSKENKEKMFHFTYIPFGEGPRMCPGYRFALIEIKVALTVLLRNYSFSLNEKTSVPVEMDPGNVLLLPKESILLDMKERKSQINNNVHT